MVRSELIVVKFSTANKNGSILVYISLFTTHQKLKPHTVFYVHWNFLYNLFQGQMVPIFFLQKRKAARSFETHGSDARLIFHRANVYREFPGSYDSPKNTFISSRWHCQQKQKAVLARNQCGGVMPGIRSITFAPTDITHSNIVLYTYLNADENPRCLATRSKTNTSFPCSCRRNVFASTSRKIRLKCSLSTRNRWQLFSFSTIVAALKIEKGERVKIKKRGKSNKHTHKHKSISV